MTKKELKTGMFGMDNDGCIFVVVGDKLMYENGQYDDVADMTEDLEFTNRHHIAELHEATCFKMVAEGRSRVIWKRPEPKCKVSNSEENKITITEDEFVKVVKEANEVFMAVAKEVPGGEIPEIIMGLQNITFGTLLASILFGKEEQ